MPERSADDRRLPAGAVQLLDKRWRRRAIGIVSGRAASLAHARQRVSISPSLLPGGFAVVGSIRP